MQKNKGEVAVETSQKRYKQYTAHKKMHKVIGLAQINVVLKFFSLNLFLCLHLEIIS